MDGRPGRVRTVTWLHAVLAAGLMALAGCSGVGGPSACTTMGAASGVIFEFDDVLVAHRGQTLLVEACVRDVCDNIRVTPRNRQHGLALGQDLVSDGSPVPVTLTITQPGGDVVYEGNLTAEPVKSQPNGEGCPPVAWSAQVYASGVHDLEQKIPPPS